MNTQEEDETKDEQSHAPLIARRCLRRGSNYPASYWTCVTLPVLSTETATSTSFLDALACQDPSALRVRSPIFV